MSSFIRKSVQCPAVRKTLAEMRVPEHTGMRCPLNSPEGGTLTSAPTSGWALGPLSGSPFMMACATPPASRMARAIVASRSTTRAMPTPLIPLHTPRRSVCIQGNRAVWLRLLLPRPPYRRTSENSLNANLGESPECELRLYGVLRSSRQLLTDGILCAGGKRPPASNLRAGERKSRAHHALHDHVPHSCGEGK